MDKKLKYIFRKNCYKYIFNKNDLKRNYYICL